MPTANSLPKDCIVKISNHSGDFQTDVTIINGTIIKVEPLKGYSKQDRFDLDCINHYYQEWQDEELSRIIATGVYQPGVDSDEESRWEDMALYGCQ